MSARVEALEHENRELRAQISALQNEPEARRLRRGRGSWLLAGLVASFFPLVAGPLFFSAPKARLPARRAHAAFDGPRGSAAQAGDGGERAGSFRGVAVRANGEGGPAWAPGPPPALPTVRQAVGPAVRPPFDVDDPWRTGPKAGRCGANGARCAPPPGAAPVVCQPGDPLCNE